MKKPFLYLAVSGAALLMSPAMAAPADAPALSVVAADQPAPPASVPSTTPPGTATPTPASQQPIDITADQTLEWHRNDQQYVAYGHVIAIQGESTSKADKMVADYRPKEGNENGTGPIYKLTGIGHVILLSQGNQVFGDKVVYNVDTSTGVVTGAHLIAVSPDQTVTARDNFIYHNDTGQMIANGDARLVRPKDDGSGNDVVTGDTESAWFVRSDAANGAPGQTAPLKTPKPAKAGAAGDTTSPTGKRHLDHMTADGHVVITTPTEIVYGDHATYDAATQIATVIDNVRIDRGPNVMTGDKAHVNMATNVSEMIANPGSKRVHALFYPNTEDTTDPTNVSHGDTTMPAHPSPASPGDALTAITPATDKPPVDAPTAEAPPAETPPAEPISTKPPPVTAANAADPDIDTPLPTAHIGAP